VPPPQPKGNTHMQNAKAPSAATAAPAPAAIVAALPPVNPVALPKCAASAPYGYIAGNLGAKASAAQNRAVAAAYAALFAASNGQPIPATTLHNAAATAGNPFGLRYAAKCGWVLPAPKPSK
jgi:hypothetical protein